MGNGIGSTIRLHFAAGGAVVGAGILTLALVAVPPNSNRAETIEARAVHLAAFAMPTAVPSPAILEKLFSRHDGPGVSVKPLGRDASGTVVAVVKTSTTPSADPKTPIATFDSQTIPAVNSALVLSDPLSLPVIGPLINAVVGPIAAVALFIFLFGVLLPLGYIVGAIYQFLDSVGVPTTLAAAKEPVAILEAGEPVASDGPPVTIAAAEPADSPQATEPNKPPLSRRMVSTKAEITSEEMSTDTAASATDPPQIATAAEASEEPTTAGASDPSANGSTSEPATHGPVVRDSLGSKGESHDPTQRGDGGSPTTKTAAGGDSAAKAGPSSGDDSPGGDGDSS
jgi:hypothetical protein